MHYTYKAFKSITRTELRIWKTKHVYTYKPFKSITRIELRVWKTKHVLQI